MQHPYETLLISIPAGHAIFPPDNAEAAPPSLLLDVYLTLSVSERRQRFVSTHEVALRYNRTQRTIQNWTNLGLIAAVRIGNDFQVDLLSVEAYLRQCEAKRELI